MGIMKLCNGNSKFKTQNVFRQPNNIVKKIYFKYVFSVSQISKYQYESKNLFLMINSYISIHTVSKKKGFHCVSVCVCVFQLIG